jgi:ribulose-5-phosphate 4-epimerase/fuculose-1-phosphate aldolase
MSHARIPSDIASTARALYASGFAEGGAGNMSLLLPNNLCREVHLDGEHLDFTSPIPCLGGRKMVITISGSRMREIGCNPARYMGILVISTDGRRAKYFGRRGTKPSGELALHLAIQSIICSEERTAVLHCHTRYTQLLPLLFSPGMIPELIRRSLTEAPMVLPKGVAVLPECVPGSRELAMLAGDAALKSDAAVLARHGVISWGKTFAEALDKIEVLEKCAESLFLLEISGRRPESGQWPPEFEEFYDRFA